MIFGIAVYIELIKAIVPFVVDLLQDGQHVRAPVIASGHGRPQPLQGIQFEFWIGRRGEQAFVGIDIEFRWMINGH